MSHLAAIAAVRATVATGISALVFKSPSFYLIMSPKHESGDAGNSDAKEKLQTASFK